MPKLDQERIVPKKDRKRSRCTICRNMVEVYKEYWVGRKIGWAGIIHHLTPALEKKCNKKLNAYLRRPEVEKELWKGCGCKICKKKGWC